MTASLKGKVIKITVTNLSGLAQFRKRVDFKQVFG